MNDRVRGKRRNVTRNSTRTKKSKMIKKSLVNGKKDTGTQKRAKTWNRTPRQKQKWAIEKKMVKRAKKQEKLGCNPSKEKR